MRIKSNKKEHICRYEWNQAVQRILILFIIGLIFIQCYDIIVIFCNQFNTISTVQLYTIFFIEKNYTNH